jgi:hypothetical protein
MNELSFWARILNEIPLIIRRRASAYLRNIKQIAENRWSVWSNKGAQYTVHVKGGKVVCSCAYYEKEGFCKHIAAVCAHQLFQDFIAWREKLRPEESSSKLKVS